MSLRLKLHESDSEKMRIENEKTELGSRLKEMGTAFQSIEAEKYCFLCFSVPINFIPSILGSICVSLWSCSLLSFHFFARERLQISVQEAEAESRRIAAEHERKSAVLLEEIQFLKSQVHLIIEIFAPCTLFSKAIFFPRHFYVNALIDLSQSMWLSILLRLCPRNLNGDISKTTMYSPTHQSLRSSHLSVKVW